jgi:hypothetical protein
MLARQTGTALVADTARRALRWLALRGSPPGSLDRPVNASPRSARASDQRAAPKAAFLNISTLVDELGSS